ncbi:hypothetical protein BH18VER1_BH18VER1_16790 [soil metagenome]
MGDTIEQHREETKQRTVVGNILRGSMGNMVEWFDFYSFTVFGTYFAHVFFASGKEDEDLLGVLGIFAAGFIMRPVGSWFFGRTRISAVDARPSRSVCC